MQHLIFLAAVLFLKTWFSFCLEGCPKGFQGSKKKFCIEGGFFSGVYHWCYFTRGEFLLLGSFVRGNFLGSTFWGQFS